MINIEYDAHYFYLIKLQEKTDMEERNISMPMLILLSSGQGQTSNFRIQRGPGRTNCQAQGQT